MITATAVEVVAGEDDDSGGITGTVVGLMALLSIAGLGIGMWWRRGRTHPSDERR